MSQLRKGRPPGRVEADLASRRHDKPSPACYAARAVERAVQALERSRDVGPAR